MKHKTLQIFLAICALFIYSYSFANESLVKKAGSISRYSMYEAYRDNADYKKAQAVLEELLKNHPLNISYKLEAARFLNTVHNDHTQSLSLINEVISLDPHNAQAYFILGKINEQYDHLKEAKEAYNKALLFGKKQELLKQAKNGLKTLQLIDDRQLISNWLVLGPFDNANDQGFDTMFPPEEKIQTDNSYTGKGDIDLRWKTYSSPDTFGYVDFSHVLNQEEHAVCYALTYIYSPRKKTVQILLGTDSSVKLWLNNTELFSYLVKREAQVDDNLINATLQKGWNTVLIKLSLTSGAWGMYFRLTDLVGNYITDIVFDPDKNTPRAKKKLFWIFVLHTIKRMSFIFLLLFVLLILILAIKTYVDRYKIKRLKEDFVSSVSHEMKNPISAIKLYCELIQMNKAQEPEKRNEYFRILFDQIDRLTNYVSNILDFSRLESGQMPYDFRKTPIAPILKKILDVFSQSHPETKISSVITPELEKTKCLIDTNSFERAILNIIFNAAKYSDNKPITFTAKMKDGTISISIIDKGPGIAKKDLKNVFKKFYRVKGTSSKTKGTGLGLTIVKKIIDAHKGKIIIDSTPGEGTTFSVMLKTTDSKTNANIT